MCEFPKKGLSNWGHQNRLIWRTLGCLFFNFGFGLVPSTNRKLLVLGPRWFGGFESGYPDSNPNPWNIFGHPEFSIPSTQRTSWYRAMFSWDTSPLPLPLPSPLRSGRPAMICGATGSLAVLVPETVQQEHGKVHLFYAASWFSQKPTSLRKRQGFAISAPQKCDVCCEGMGNSFRKQAF